MHCNTFNNTETSNTSYINLHMLILRCMIYRSKTNEHNKAKGVSNSVVKQILTFNDHNDTLETNKSLVRYVVSIRSFNPQLFTYTIKKYIN